MLRSRRSLRSFGAGAALASVFVVAASWSGCSLDTSGTGADVVDASADVSLDTRPGDAPPSDAPSCSDGIKDGDETDFDCGGSHCPPCSLGQHCLVALDCDTSLCSMGFCVGPGCTNGVRDGSETDVDCGGPSCGKCADGKECAQQTDCSNGFCNPASNTCGTPSCSDGVKNGTETDVDCGGPNCGKCADGKHCAGAGDCANGFCNPTTGACATPTCADGFKNGAETDVDCGGPSCGKCAAGKGCAAGGDCASGTCSGGSCQAYPISCKALLATAPATPSGVYIIDPDGAGPNPPFGAYCDMTTDGGGWTFFAHVNQDYLASSFFQTNVGSYRADLVDDNTTYGRASWILPFVSHTQMMISVDTADVPTAAAMHKFVVYQYASGAAGFNDGPLPCTGLAAGFEFRTSPSGPFTTGGTAARCDSQYWYPTNAAGAFLIMMNSAGGVFGAYVGAGVGGDGTWNHDAWWWIR